MGPCTVCGTPFEEHKAAEESGAKHHEWSGDGRLRHVGVTNPRPADGAAPSRGLASSSPPADPVLRLVLIEKGIITAEDLTRVEQLLAVSGMAFAKPPAYRDAGH